MRPAHPGPHPRDEPMKGHRFILIQLHFLFPVTNTAIPRRQKEWNNHRLGTLRPVESFIDFSMVKDQTSSIKPHLLLNQLIQQHLTDRDREPWRKLLFYSKGPFALVQISHRTLISTPCRVGNTWSLVFTSTQGPSIVERDKVYCSHTIY